MKSVSLTVLVWIVSLICIFIGCSTPNRGTNDAYSMAEASVNDQIYFKNWRTGLCFVGYDGGMGTIDYRSVSNVACTPAVDSIIINPHAEAIDLIPVVPARK